MLETLEMAPADPILGLTEAFKKDPNLEKINLGVGIYVDADGTSPIFKAVRAAEEKILKTEKSKTYLGIAGSPEYGKAVRELIFEPGHPMLEPGRAATAQSPGGTGALRTAGDFLRFALPEADIWFSKPTWANHVNIFQAAGFEPKSYAYYNAATHQLDLDAMLNDLRTGPKPGDIVLLHGCCHNPTGVDPTPEQWEQIAELLVERKLIPLVDLAYQGFGTGIEQDVAGVRIIGRKVPELLICSSYSKNFGLYSERIGALTVACADPQATGRSFSHVKRVIRANYSNPPAHGSLIVQTILADADLNAMWQTELTEIRNRILGIRKLFAETMQRCKPDVDFSFMAREIGMFSMTPLKPEMCDALIKDHAIYLVRSGRVNVAGMSESNMDRLCKAFASVM